MDFLDKRVSVKGPTDVHIAEQLCSHQPSPGSPEEFTQLTPESGPFVSHKFCSPCTSSKFIKNQPQKLETSGVTSISLLGAPYPITTC